MGLRKTETACLHGKDCSTGVRPHALLSSDLASKILYFNAKFVIRGATIHTNSALYKPMLILKVGDTFPEMARLLGDFEDWIRDGLGPVRYPISVVDPRHSAALPDIRSLAGVVISGSHAMVSNREPWSERLVPWLRELVGAGVPVLGLCYGHQLLAHAFGGVVDFHPRGIEIGTTSIAKGEAGALDPLFGALPHTFSAHVVHRQAVLRLPPDAVVLARNGFEPHHAFRLGDRAWGVQFHPEFDERAMQGYLQCMKDSLAKEGIDAGDLLARTVSTPAAASILRKFGEFVSGQVETENETRNAELQSTQA